MKVLIFGGTTEGRTLAEKLAGRVSVAVSVATGLGAEELSGIPGITVLTGRKDASAIAALLPGFDLCIDATHPYAAEATANIRAACTETGTPLYRLLRAESAGIRDSDRVIRVKSPAAAADFLAGTTGNILLTTGAKELAAFGVLPKERLFARVLPTHESLSMCETLGLPHRNILALQGPFTQRMNEAMMEQYHIAWLVTKDSGKAGGFEEKRAAAENAGAKLLLIGRPEETETGESTDTILKIIEEKLRKETP